MVCSKAQVHVIIKLEMFPFLSPLYGLGRSILELRTNNCVLCCLPVKKSAYEIESSKPPRPWLALLVENVGIVAKANRERIVVNF